MKLNRVLSSREEAAAEELHEEHEDAHEAGEELADGSKPAEDMAPAPPLGEPETVQSSAATRTGKMKGT